jgi:uncharacterized membrane protein
MALLGLTGGSLALFAVTIGSPDMGLFFAGNAIAPERRVVLSLAVLGGGASAVLAVVLTLLISGGRAAPEVIRIGDRFGPLMLAAFVPTLFDHRTWTGKPLVFLMELAVTALIAERLVARSLATLPGLFRLGATVQSSSRIRRWLPLALVIIGALAYAIYFSHFTLLNHRRFGTSGFDLGINVNWCYNALHGHPFRSTVLHGPNGGNFLAGHAIFAMFLWLPIFAINPGPEVLLIYQSVMCGLAAIPLFLVAKELVPRSAAVIVALTYLMFAPLHGPNFYDYHELPVALPFHFLLYYCIVKRRYGWAALFVFILYAHREDVSVGLAMLGAFLVLSGTRPRFGLALTAASVIAFLLIKFVLMPAAGPWHFAEMIYKELQPAGTKGYAGVVQTILINPVYFLSTLLTEEKLIYLLHLFAPVLFLPLRRPALALLAMPGFFFTLMTTNYAPTLSIAFQYTTHWIPYVFLATILSLKLLRDHAGPARQWGALIALALGVASHSTMYGAVVQHESFVGGFSKIVFHESAEDRKRYAAFNKLIAKIPRDASIAASEREVPHVAARLNVYTLNYAHGDADFLLIRRPAANRSVIAEAFRRNKYGLLARVDKTFYLFKKNHAAAETAKAKRELGIR